MYGDNANAVQPYEAPNPVIPGDAPQQWKAVNQRDSLSSILNEDTPNQVKANQIGTYSGLPATI